MVRVTRVFVPGNDSLMASFGLLLLRLWLGGAMLLLHGWDKISHFSGYAKEFPDPLHIGHGVSLGLAVFAETVCSLLLLIGLVTRFASAILVINMVVAFTLIHQLALSGEHSGELAFIYLAGYVALLVAGPGRFSADAVFFGKA